ncbi:MAG: site-specific DNA-methyltransferase [Opitutaceae bacterium]|nr:site-specific DNA-methyltransferase [Opitutaceae bacterium]
MSEALVTSSATPAFQKLVAKLREVFQIDQPDLDFGIYRIINARAAEIGDYLENQLRAKVDASLATGQQAGLADLQRELAAAEQQLRDLGVDPDSSTKVKDLRARVAALSGGVTEHRDAVFSHLLTFFSRYYDRGDFISQRRYKGDTYAIPYSGEEVVLHWANKDQYYTKSGENFSNYTFALADGRRVHFRLASADTAKDDRKDTDLERRFRLIAPRTVTRTGDDGEEVQEQQVPIVEVAAVPAAEGRPATSAELILWFEYVPLPKKGDSQDTLNARARDTILADAAVKARWLDLAQRKPTEKNPQRTLLDKQLEDYTQKNKADYFIHKDLGGFLRRELDFYIKNEVMHLDDVQNAASFADIEKSLRMIQCLRAIALDLIAFLAQLEDFQKKLWLKKKFVVEAHYCITLDRLYKLGEDLDAKDTTRPGVLAEREWLLAQIAANEKQIAAWINLGLVKNTACEPVVASTDPLFAQASAVGERLRANPFLMVDTQWFSTEFKYRLAAQIHGIDEQCDGLLVHSDNFQALNLLQNRFRGTIKSIYIDPPYNTGHDGFIYKDSFRSSSWLAMIRDRLSSARNLLCEKGALFCSIDKFERDSLIAALRSTLGPQNHVEELIWVKDTVSNNAPLYSTNHEYIEVFAANKKLLEEDPMAFRETRQGYREVMDLIGSYAGSFPNLDEVAEKIKELYRKHRQNYLSEADAQGTAKEEAEKNDPWKGIYPYHNVEYRDIAGRYVDPSHAKERAANIWVWRKVEPSMPTGKQADSTRDKNSDNFRFYSPPHPTTGFPCKAPKRGWAFPQKQQGDRPSFESYVKDNRLWFSDDPDAIPQQKYFLHEVGSVVATSVFRQYADGEPKLEALFGKKGLIPNPKPPELIARLFRQTVFEGETIADFFAGSGTSGEAAINLVRADGKRRKYILVEMGSHFERVLKMRLLKSVYSPNWKEGEPQDHRLGSSHCIKYLRLEAYEDTLNNLALKRPDGLLDLFDPAGKEDYLLHYMLNVESQASLLSVGDFKKPFDYKLRIATDSAGACQTRAVDLVETFNYLLGLRVAHLDAKLDLGYVLVSGKLPDGQSCLVVWRDCEKLDYEATSKLLERHKITPNDNEYDVVYINGDHNIPTVAQATEAEGGVTRQLTLRQIEPEFITRMFAGEEL